MRLLRHISRLARCQKHWIAAAAWRGLPATASYTDSRTSLVGFQQSAAEFAVRSRQCFLERRSPESDSATAVCARRGRGTVLHLHLGHGTEGLLVGRVGDVLPPGRPVLARAVRGARVHLLLRPSRAGEHSYARSAALWFRHRDQAGRRLASARGFSDRNEAKQWVKASPC